MHNSRIFTFFIDSGADISVVPSKLVEGLDWIKLDSPMCVRGFDGFPRVGITHRVELTLDFSPGVLQTSFYVADIPQPILGADNLQEESTQLSLETGKGILHIASDIILTKSTVTELIAELVPPGI